ncbi:MAG TPA: vitamin B12 dependent-methionine synthase activation domain-containing protein [Ignavibacteriales bacterium]|nr:vitamin B12 dependent-methionine synthase activation domain-containing protein [Ignavibacteriales bacterium]
MSLKEETYTLYPEAAELPFDRECTRKYLKIGSSAENLEAMLDVCRGVFLKYTGILKPVLRYRLLEIIGKDAGKMSITFNDGSALSGKGIFRLLKHSERAAAYAITLGDEIDKHIHGLEEEDFLESYLLNAASSAVIEALQLKLHDIIGTRAQAEGFQLTKRFSPGYAGWDLSEQGILIPMLHGSEIGIALTESFLMLPMKSVSGIYGFNR